MPATSSAIDNSKSRDTLQGPVFPPNIRKRKREPQEKPDRKTSRGKIGSGRQSSTGWVRHPENGGVSVVVSSRVLSDRSAELIERAQALAPLIAGAAERIEAKREIPEPVLAALHEARLFRMLLPRSYDGEEVEPA